ncbi:MAG: hypothetical protein H0U29_05690, partial [Acidimicrobiia bacterium]|nr:hypothetical protein [Acidimicrobiia bacterium]
MTSPMDTDRRGLLKRLYHGDTHGDIVGRWKLWFAVSGVLLLIGAATIANGGLKLGIDFTGGTVWQVAAGKAEVDDIQQAMSDLGYEDVQVQEVTQASGGTNTRFLRVEAEASVAPAGATEDALAKASSDLGNRRSDVPADARGRIDDVRDNIDALGGPFADDVPAPLKDLQDEVDNLPATLKSAKDKPAAARRAADRMLTHTTDLS